MTSLNIKNAEIKTANVEIKTLTVSGKQVTLSVFKQIPESPIIDEETWKLNGIPWGNINYFWGEHKDCHEKDFFHILWQKGNDLKRSIVYKNSYEFIRKLKAILDFEATIYAIKFLEDKEPRNEYSRYAIDEHEYNLSYIIKNIEDNENFLKDIREGRRNSYNLDFYTKELERFIKLKEETINLIKCKRTHYEESLKKIKEDTIKIEEIVRSFHDLPHLFIAI